MFTGNHDFYNIYGPEDIPQEEAEKLLGDIAQEIVERGLVAPAIFYLEIAKPLSFIGSQLMVMANPLVQMLFSSKNYWKFTVLMEKRENVELLIREIERRNNEYKERLKKDTGNRLRKHNDKGNPHREEG